MADTYQQLIEARRYRDVITQTNEALRANARDADAALFKGIAHRFLGEADDAVVSLRTASELTHGEARARAELALALYRQQKYDEALVEANAAHAADAELTPALKVKAAILRIGKQAGGLYAAEALLLKAKNWDKDPLLLSELAVVQYESGREDAIDTALRALQLDPASETALGLAVHTLQRRDPEKLRKLLDAAVSQEPENAAVLSYCAAFELEVKANAEAAITYAMKAKTLRPRDQMIRKYLISALALGGRNEEALAETEAACAENPQSGFLQYELAGAYMNRGRFDDVRKLLPEMRKARRLGDDYHLVNLELIRREGRWEDARAAVHDALEEAPDSIYARGAIAYLYASMRDYAEAHRVLDEFVGGHEYLFHTKVILYINEGKLRAARELIDSKLESSDHYLLHVLKAWLDANAGKYGDAARTIDDALARNPANDLLYVIKTETLLMQWHYAEAAEIADNALKKFPFNYDLLIDSAFAKLQLKNILGATAQINGAIAINRGSTLALQIKSMILAADPKRVDDAYTLLHQSAKDHPHSVGLRVLRGFLRLRHDRDLDMATRDFNTALKLSPCSLMSRTGLGLAALQRHDTETALHWLRQVVEMQKSPGSQINLAWALISDPTTRNLREAEVLCEEALAVQPASAGAYACLGAIASHRHQRFRAERYLDKAVLLDGTDVDHIVNLGSLRSRLGKYEQAAESLTKALELDPLHVRALVELALVRTKEENYGEARRLARRAVDAEPQNGATWRMLAKVYALEENFAQAEACLREAIGHLDGSETVDLRVDLSHVLLCLGDTSGQTSRYREAVRHALFVLRQFPRRGDARVLLGLAYLKLGEAAAAVKELTVAEDESRYREYVHGFLSIAREQVRGEPLRIGSPLHTLIIALIVAQLVGVWFAFMTGSKFSATALTAAIPLLLGMLILAFVLPNLTSFKVATIEAQLKLPKSGVDHDELIGPSPQVEMSLRSRPSWTLWSSDV
jgi:tetratricopeptide (TPR) repeat protein